MSDVCRGRDERRACASVCMGKGDPDLEKWRAGGREKAVMRRRLDMDMKGVLYDDDDMMDRRVTPEIKHTEYPN